MMKKETYKEQYARAKKEAARLKEWEYHRRLLNQERADALNRIRVRGREIKQLQTINNRRAREINIQYERALTRVNQRYAKARGMKF